MRNFLFALKRQGSERISALTRSDIFLFGSKVASPKRRSEEATCSLGKSGLEGGKGCTRSMCISQHANRSTFCVLDACSCMNKWKQVRKCDFSNCACAGQELEKRRNWGLWREKPNKAPEEKRSLAFSRERVRKSGPATAKAQPLAPTRGHFMPVYPYFSRHFHFLSAPFSRRFHFLSLAFRALSLAFRTLSHTFAHFSPHSIVPVT